MAVVPIEVIRIGSVSAKDLSKALALANSIQQEFYFVEMPEYQSAGLRMHAYNQARAPELLDTIAAFRENIRGFHPFVPFLIAFTSSHLDGNLFGSGRAKEGIAVCTTANVPDIIIPADRLVSYYTYYLARYTLSFIAPNHRIHVDSRKCIFDSKINKIVLLESMRAGALCDECRRKLVDEPGLMTTEQFNALDNIFALAGRILLENTKPKAFIGSSKEGLKIAKKLKDLLAKDLSVVVWDQDEVFGLGHATLETLEEEVLKYQYGIFVFTPDDKIHVRGTTRRVARDNVIFELGLFIGKLDRHRVFVVNPSKNSITLPSDLAGITTATFDPDEKKLDVALENVCDRIREAIKNAS